MVQTRRRARLRGAALLRLPTDGLHKIATHTVSPGLVVAAGKHEEARTALRKGTDTAERSRFGGIGLTIEEPEHVLRTRYHLPDSDLASREAAGMALTTRSSEVKYEVGADGVVIIYEELVEALLAYGAEASVPAEASTPEGTNFGNTILHLVYLADDPVALARLLLAAGADIDARCHPPNGAGLSPLTWCIECGDGRESSYDVAIFLIEQGCDVVQAAADFSLHQFSTSSTIIEVLDSHVGTEGNRHLVDLITAALDAAGPARREAAENAARQYADAWRERRHAELAAEVLQYDDSESD